MSGKERCKALKEIRKKIEEENDIEYVVSECTFKGECRGTCPKSEEELKTLEEELDKRKRLGKTVAIVCISASVIVGLGVASEVMVETGHESIIERVADYFDSIIRKWRGDSSWDIACFAKHK